MDRWLEIIEADDADKVGLTSIRKKRRADQYKVGKVADKVAEGTDAVGEADKVAQVANSYAGFDLQKIKLPAAKKPGACSNIPRRKKAETGPGLPVGSCQKICTRFRVRMP